MLWNLSYLNYFLHESGINHFSLKSFEDYPLMALKFCCWLYFSFIFVVIVIERTLVGKILRLKSQSLFYKSYKANMLIAYFILLYFSDEDSFNSVPDFFIYFLHFTLYSSVMAFKEVLDVYCKNILASQVSYDSIPESALKIKKIKNYYRILKYQLMFWMVCSIVVFSEVDKLRLYCLYAPGIKVLIDWYLSYENLYYKYKTTVSINEKVIISSLNYSFFLNTTSMLVQMVNYFIIFSKTGISITFSFIHMYYMMRNFKFLFAWIKECEKFIVFHKHKRLITHKCKLVLFGENKRKNNENLSQETNDIKEEWAICLNYLEKARELPWMHHFHLICLLQLIKNGDKKCPICRQSFDEDNNKENGNQERGGLQNINEMNFYGLEDD